MLLSLAKLRTLAIRIALSGAGRVFFGSLSCWLLAFFYCRFRYWRDPHSAFFNNSDLVYDWKYTAVRRQEGLDFLDRLGKQNVPPWKATQDLEICAAFVTVKRSGEQYIEAAIGSLLEGLTEWERSKLFLAVLFGDNEPESHPTWKANWLEKATDWHGTYNVTTGRRNHLRYLMEQHLYYEKGVFDYMYALQLCYDTGAPYILIVEDDIIVADSWLVKTKKAIQDIENATNLGKPAYNYLYLRLFFTETALRWRPKEDFWFRRMDLLMLLAACATGSCLLMLRRLVPRARILLNTWSVVILSTITVPAFIILLFMIGKYSLFPLTGVNIMNRYGCCSQALLYPRDRVPDMIKWFEDWKEVSHWDYVSTDVMIDHYARQIGVDLLALGPQLVQHVGIMSSRDNLDINGRSTRAFWFEDYKSENLRSDHDRLLMEFGHGT